MIDLEGLEEVFFDDATGFVEELVLVFLGADDSEGLAFDALAFSDAAG